MNDKGSMAEAEQIDATLQSIAQLLRDARAPLIYGLTRLTVEAQELAVELAMCLRGAIDTPRGSRIPPRGTSLQLHGETHTTLGELRKYADLLVWVECEPTREQRESFAIQTSTVLSDRQLHELKFVSSDAANFETRVRELSCQSMDDVLALRKKLKSSPTNDPAQEQLLAAWQSAKYPVLIYRSQNLVQSLGRGAASYLIEELERAALARAKFGRAAVWPLEDAGDELSNAAGAEYVLTASTGYPAAVQCFNGYAEFLPGVTNAETLLADGVIDAVLFLGEGPAVDWSDAAQKHLQRIPRAMVARHDVLQDQTLNHQITCSLLNEEQGTILREDGVPLRLELLNGKAECSTESKRSPAGAEEILRRLLVLVREPATALQGAAR